MKCSQWRATDPGGSESLHEHTRTCISPVAVPRARYASPLTGSRGGPNESDVTAVEQPGIELTFPESRLMIRTPPDWSPATAAVSEWLIAHDNTGYPRGIEYRGYDSPTRKTEHVPLCPPTTRNFPVSGDSSAHVTSLSPIDSVDIKAAADIPLCWRIASVA